MATEFKYMDLLLLFPEGMNLERVKAARAMAQGYALGRLHGNVNADHGAPFDFSLAYGIWVAECRLFLDFDTPSLPVAWERFTNGLPVSDYRRRLGEGESRPVPVGQ